MIHVTELSSAVCGSVPSCASSYFDSRTCDIFFLKSDLEHGEVRVFFVILVLISQLHRIDILPLVIQ